METYNWLFNAYRRLGTVSDPVDWHLENDYIVMIRRGHTFQVPLMGQRRSYLVW